MATLEDKILGEKLHNYCSSSESEYESGDEGLERDTNNRNGHISELSESGATLSEPSTWGGTSANTGPKGVIKDWQRFKQIETEKRLDQERERLALIEKLSITSGTHTDDAKTKEKEEFDAELEELMSDEFLLQYQKHRMQEMLSMSGQLPTFGKVQSLHTGQEFLDAIDKENKNIMVIIHVYEASVPACINMNKCFDSLAQQYREVKFCKMIGSAGGLSKAFKVGGVPALLVYKNGQMIGNFVRISDDLGDDCYLSDVEAFLIEHGMLPDKSCFPGIVSEHNDNDSDSD